MINTLSSEGALKLETVHWFHNRKLLWVKLLKQNKQLLVGIYVCRDWKRIFWVIFWHGLHWTFSMNMFLCKYKLSGLYFYLFDICFIAWRSLKLTNCIQLMTWTKLNVKQILLDYSKNTAYFHGFNHIDFKWACLTIQTFQNNNCISIWIDSCIEIGSQTMEI